MKLRTLVLFLFILLTACAKVNYVGESHPKKESIEIFYDENKITRPHTIMGMAVGKSTFFSSKTVQASLIRRAKKEGADAILILGLDNLSYRTDEYTVVSENHITAKFILYTDSSE